MSYKQDNYTPTKPQQAFKDEVENYHNWYLKHYNNKYLFEPKDFSNLKYLLRKCTLSEITLTEFLENITQKWYLDNASIPLFNSHFNQLYAKQKKGEHPNYFDRKYYRTLEGPQVVSS